jgi:hypothetical protein
VKRAPELWRAPLQDPALQTGRLPASRLLLMYGLFLAGMLPLYLFLAADRFSTVARIWAWAGLMLGLYPTLRVLISKQDGHSHATGATSVATLGMWLALFFHLAVFHEERLLLRWGEARISEPSVDLALLLAALATPALLLGYSLGGALNLPRILPHPRLDVPLRPLQVTGTLIVLASLLTDILWLRRELTVYQPAVSVIAVLTPADLGFAMVLLPTLRPQSKSGNNSVGKHSQLWFWLLFAAAAAIALMRGMLTPLMKPLVIYLLGQLFICKRLRLWPVITALGAVVLLQPVKAEFRQRIWDRQVEMSLTERAVLYLDLTAQHWLGSDIGPTVDKEHSVRVAAARTGAALQLAHVIELTPSAVPHQYGATYRYLRFALMPRVFFPDKPIAQHADVWAAVIYGYTTKAGTAHVMVGLSQLAEAYVNFGAAGALLVMLLLGLMLRAMEEIFAHPQAGTGALALHLYFVQGLAVTFEGSLAQYWGGIVQSFLLYGLAMAVLASTANRRR